MVCLTELPKQEDLTILQQFYNRKDPVNTTPHLTHLLVDDCVIPVNTIVLSWWSTKFQDLRDEDNGLFLEGFKGHSEQVKDCLELLHGYDVPISFDNVQIILKFGLLFEMETLTNIAEKWLENNLKYDKDENNMLNSKVDNSLTHSQSEYSLMSDRSENSLFNKVENNLNVEDDQKNDITKYEPDTLKSLNVFVSYDTIFTHSERFIKTLKIAVVIERFIPEYNFVFDISAEAYNQNPEECAAMIKEEFEVVSPSFMRYAFRNVKTAKLSLGVLEKVSRSHDNLNRILEILSEFMSRSDTMASKFSSVLISLLQSFTEIELSLELTKKIMILHTTCQKIILGVINLHQKPWRSIDKVQDLFDFRKANCLSVSEYMYVEIIIDWLKYKDNYKSLSLSDQNFLYNSIHQINLNYTFFKEKDDVFKDYFTIDLSKTLCDLKTSYKSWDNAASEYYNIQKHNFSSFRIKSTFGCNVFDPTKCNKCKSLCITFSDMNDTSLNIEVTQRLRHPTDQCPEVRICKRIVEFRKTKNSNHYMSSEIFTYQEIEEFVNENPECYFKIILIYEK